MPTELVSFDTAYKQLIERWEDPHYSGKVTTDAGGKTRFGISESAYPSLDIASLTFDKARDIAFKDYWCAGGWNIKNLQADCQPLANKLFQFGFNIGVGSVIQIANLCEFISRRREEIPKLGEHLILNPEPIDYLAFTNMLAAAQLSRYIKDYHILARVPHSLLDRALCIE